MRVYFFDLETEYYLYMLLSRYPDILFKELTYLAHNFISMP